MFLKRIALVLLPCVLVAVLYQYHLRQYYQARRIMLTTELRAALEAEDYSTVSRLIYAGANPNTTSYSKHSRGIEDDTPLFVAVNTDNNDLLRYLLSENADINFPFSNGKYALSGIATPLMWAARRGNLEGVSLLIAHGANANAQESHGFSVLDLVCIDDTSKQRSQHLIAIEALLRKAGAKTGGQLEGGT